MGALVSDSTVNRWVVLLPVRVSLRQTEGDTLASLTPNRHL